MAERRPDVGPACIGQAGKKKNNNLYFIG